MVELGLKGETRAVVTPDITARAMRSGYLDVLATPMLIALMEEASLLAVAPHLEEGMDTVGTRVDIAHLAATPLGMSIRVESELIEIDRRRLVFSVKAYDERELIGEGTHERFIINVDKFLAKCEAKGLKVK